MTAETDRYTRLLILRFIGVSLGTAVAFLLGVSTTGIAVSFVLTTLLMIVVTTIQTENAP